MRFLLLVAGLIVGAFGFFTLVTPGPKNNEMLGTSLMIVGAVMFAAGGAAIDVVASIQQSQQPKQ